MLAAAPCRIKVDKVFTRRSRDDGRMLFHVHHHRDEKTCPAHNAEVVSASFGAVLPALAENGVNVVGAGSIHRAMTSSSC